MKTIIFEAEYCSAPYEKTGSQWIKDGFDIPREWEASKIQVYTMFVKVQQLLQTLPTGANPRQREATKKLHSVEVRKSLLDREDPFFSYKSKGQYAFADSVSVEQKAKGKKLVSINFNEVANDGYFDGGTTYRLIQSCAEDLPQQEIKITVFTGIPLSKRVDIAESHNRADIVRQYSLMNARGYFEGIKTAIKDKPWEKAINFFEGDSGSMSVNDVVRLMCLANISKYDLDRDMLFTWNERDSITDGTLASNYDEFNCVYPILNDLLYLFDFIRIEGSQEAVKQCMQEGRYQGKTEGCIKFREHLPGLKRTTKKTRFFDFMQREHSYDMCMGVTLPIFNAARQFVSIGKTGNLEWSIPFSEVLKGFSNAMPEVIKEVRRELKNNAVDAVAKNSSHWKSIMKSLRYVVPASTLTRSTEKENVDSKHINWATGTIKQQYNHLYN